MIIDKPEQIELYRMLVLRKALELEMKDIYMHRGKTAYSAIKQMFNIKGSRQKVYDAFTEIINTIKIQEGEA